METYRVSPRPRTHSECGVIRDRPISNEYIFQAVDVRTLLRCFNATVLYIYSYKLAKWLWRHETSSSKFIYLFVYLFILFCFSFFFFHFILINLSIYWFSLFFFVLLFSFFFLFIFFCSYCLILGFVTESCHDISIFYLKLSPRICLFRCLFEVSVYCIMCKSIVAIINWGFLQWQQVGRKVSYPMVV